MQDVPQTVDFMWMSFTNISDKRVANRGEVFSNAGWATWVQTLVVLIGVVIALITLHRSVEDRRVTASLEFSHRYFLGDRPLSVTAGHLRNVQYLVVQDAKRKIPNYNQTTEKAAGFTQLFATAQPMVLDKIKSDIELGKQYDAVASFFRAAVLCVEAGACDEDTMVKLLAPEMLAFYNAVCPYIEYDEDSYNDEDTSSVFLRFLVNSGNYRDEKMYFCRVKLQIYLKA
jgi:hypothetical protein